MRQKKKASKGKVKATAWPTGECALGVCNTDLVQRPSMVLTIFGKCDLGRTGMQTPPLSQPCFPRAVSGRPRIRILLRKLQRQTVYGLPALDYTYTSDSFTMPQR